MNSSAKNNTRFPKEMLEMTLDILRYMGSLSYLTFCLLASVVLCYYVRRRYLLARDIKNISKNDLTNPCYQNHLKNLRIKSMISTFIIVILCCEILYYFASLVCHIKRYASEFLILNPAISYILFIVAKCSDYVDCIAFSCQIAIPCLLMKVLWLAYLHCPYENTIKRWSCCIIVRCVVTLTFQLLEDAKFPYYQNEIAILFSVLMIILFSLDFVLYIFYARRFYKHLKSRETEARLFKDRASYRSERTIRVHFKVASILIAVAISFYVIAILFEPSNFYFLFNIPCVSRNFEIFSHQIFLIFWVISNLFYFLYSTLMSLNYLYFATMLLGIYLRQKWRLNRVNEKIKPIVAKYHATLYYRRC